MPCGSKLPKPGLSALLSDDGRTASDDVHLDAVPCHVPEKSKGLQLLANLLTSTHGCMHVVMSIRKLLCAMWLRNPKACSHSPLFSPALMAELHVMMSLWMQLFAMWLNSAAPIPPT